MSDTLLFGSVLLATSSVILTIYSGHAKEKGLPQGKFFANGTAMLLGYAGLLAVVVIDLMKAEFWALIAVGVISFFGARFVLQVLDKNAQVASLIGAIVGLLIALNTPR